MSNDFTVVIHEKKIQEVQVEMFENVFDAPS